jgi:hypothetical protein
MISGQRLRPAGYVGGQWFGMAKFSFMFGLVLAGEPI